MKNYVLHWLGGALILGAIACGSSDPVAKLIRDLDNYPEYSLIVDDLRVDDGFFADYFLRFKMVTAAGKRIAGQDTLVYESRQTEWLEVEEHVFAQYQNYLGMVVASKDSSGRHTGAKQAHPPGYQYVGNPHYGHWNSGGFWQFYGQYALMRDLMGGWNVGRDDYRDYRRSYERGRPYYGPKTGNTTTFGTQGSQTKKTNPNFYQRYQSRRNVGRQAFAQKSQNRMGRSSSSWGRGHSRSGK